MPLPFALLAIPVAYKVAAGVVAGAGVAAGAGYAASRSSDSRSERREAERDALRDEYASKAQFLLDAHGLRDSQSKEVPENFREARDGTAGIDEELISALAVRLPEVSRAKREQRQVKDEIERIHEAMTLLDSLDDRRPASGAHPRKGSRQDPD